LTTHVVYQSRGADLMMKTFSEGLFVPANVSFEIFQKINEINTRTFTKLAELQFNLASLGLEGSVAQAKLLSNAENYTDLYSIESSFATTYSDKLIKISQETTGVIMESGDELAAVVEQIFATAKGEVTAMTAPGTTKKPVAKPAVKTAAVAAKKAEAKPVAKTSSKNNKAAKKSGR